jgi:ribosome-binding factor A
MTERMRRVNESVRAVVAEAVGGLGDPRLGIVTVTGVSVSPDLHDARVYVSVLGGAKRRAGAMAALESARGVVQGRLARELRMKRTPHLTFEYDPSVERGVHMTKLIDELAPNPPSDDAPGAADAD